MSWSPALPPNAWLRWDVVSRLLPAGARDVLEIGCGQGGFAVRLARRYRYLGIDLDLESLALARSRLEHHGVGGELRHGDLSTVAHDELFDLICAFEVLEHLDDDRSAVESWAAHLRPGGSLMLSTPAWQSRFADWDELVGHYRRYDHDQAVELLERAGLKGVTVSPFGGPLGYCLEGVRNALGKRRQAAAEHESMQSRTLGSGRLLRLPDGTRAAIPYLATFPFMRLQRLMPGRGTGLVVTGRRPRS